MWAAANPQHFKAKVGGGTGTGDGSYTGAVTAKQFLAMSNQQKAKLSAENPEAFAKLQQSAYN